MQRRGRRLVVRIREFCRNESIGVVAPVGFIALWVVWQVITVFLWSFLYPVLVKVFEGDKDFDGLPLELSIFGIDLLPSNFLVESIAAVGMFLLLYYVFVRPIPEDSEPDRGMRECPECFSEIVIDARRCPFCTSAVEPLPGDAVDAEG